MPVLNKTPVYRDIPELVEDCYARLLSHKMVGRKWGLPYHFYRPALTKYSPCQWLWDSGWHMIVWSYRQPQNSIAELETLLQFQRPDGFIPETIFWETDKRLKIVLDLSLFYSHKEYSDLTQMPMLAYSLRAIWQATRDKQLLQKFVPRLVKNLEWWQSRDHDHDGLTSIIHPWESGMDASPIYDPAFHLNRPRPWDMYYHFWRLIHDYGRIGWDQDAILKREWFNFEDVGLCSVYADGWGVLADLAAEFDAGLAARCRQQHQQYQTAVLRKCWDPERRQFVSYFHQQGVEKASRSGDSSGFASLVAG